MLKTKKELTVEQRVISAFQDWAEERALDLDITPDTDLVEKYNPDSLETVEMILYLEEEFDINIKDTDVSQLFNIEKGEYQISEKSFSAPVKEIVKYITQRLEN